MERCKRTEILMLATEGDCPLAAFADELLLAIQAVESLEYPGKVHRAIYAALRKKCS